MSKLTASGAKKATRIFEKDTQMIRFVYNNIYFKLLKQEFDKVDTLEQNLVKYLPGLSAKFAKHSKITKQEALELYDKYVQEVREAVFTEAKIKLNQENNETTSRTTEQPIS